MKSITAYRPGKQSWLKFAVSFALGSCTAALLCWLLEGPKLGVLYDFLLTLRPGQPIARELLIIDTPSGAEDSGNVLEPFAAASLIITLSEFDASALILEASVLGLAAGSPAGEEEVRYHFDREFDLLSGNIRNFFDAIRTGSIPPSESARYVDELVKLSERGKERLVTLLVKRDGDGVSRLESAARVFGNVRRPGLFVQVIGSGEGGTPPAPDGGSEYFRPEPDPDGVLRRVWPLRFFTDGSTREHIIYNSLKPRFRRTEILSADTGQVLVMENQRGAVTSLSLDANGALLFEALKAGDDFRRISLEDFITYDEADKSLRRLLGEAEPLGVFSLLPGEKNPLFLYDYGLSLLDELLFNPDYDRKAAWRNIRNDYFTALDTMLYGDSEVNLVGNLQVLLSAAGLDETEGRRIRIRRESLNRMFTRLREAYQAVLDVRAALESCLEGSFCILGPGLVRSGADSGLPRPAFPAAGPFSRGSASFRRTYSDTEASALLANAILTGRSVAPVNKPPLIAGAAALALLLAFVLRSLKVFTGLVIGLALTLIAGLAFSLAFVVSGFWRDPAIFMTASGTVTLVSLVWAFAGRLASSRRFRACFGPFVSPRGLRRLVREGRPWPGELITGNAAIIAIRNPELTLLEFREQPQTSGAAAVAFREKVSGVFGKAGATVLGNGGDLALACFGSPLERIIAGESETPPSEYGAPAVRAVECIAGLLRHDESRSWLFALDFGLCSFVWTPLSGYSVFGRPVINARLLSGLAEQRHAEILITGSVREALPDMPVIKRGALREKDGSPGEFFYELLPQGAS